jgi:hypothetical protein
VTCPDHCIQTLGGGSSDLPAHVIIITVFLIFFSTIIIIIIIINIIIITIIINIIIITINIIIILFKKSQIFYIKLYNNISDFHHLLEIHPCNHL